MTVVTDQPPQAQTAATAASKEEIIKECVEMVMEILNHKNER